MKKEDYYKTLEVSRDVSAADLKAAYRKAAMKYHPDRNPGDRQAEERFKAASEAYEVLNDAQKRQIYDRFGHEGLSGQGYHGPSDVNDIFSAFGNIFEDFFGFSGGSRGGSRARRGADLRYDMTLTFEEAIFGLEREIEFERKAQCTGCQGSGAQAGTVRQSCSGCRGTGQIQKNQGFFTFAMTCPTCQGEGKIIKEHCKQCRGQGHVNERKVISVKVPPGVDSGLRLRVSNEGEGGGAGGPPGDLYVILNVKESEVFQRDGVDIVLKQGIGFAQAALGCQLEVPTLEGPKVITIPPGAQQAHRITIPGAGVPHLRGVGRGDFFVELDIQIPRKLSKEQRELLERFIEISDAPGKKTGGGFFQRIFE